MVQVVTDDPQASACPACGVFSSSVRQRRTTRPRDLPYGEEPLAVRWHKAQYACREELCPRKAFTEQIGEVPAGARVTGRLRRAAGKAVGGGQAVSGAAADFGISWPVVHHAFVARADALLAEPAPVRVLGIDETRRGRASWAQEPLTGRWRRSERFETNFVDLVGDQGLLGQTAGRTKLAVTTWLDECGQDWKDSVAVVAMDPCAAYRRAVQLALPQAIIVADHFHVVRLANQAVTEVRQRVTRTQTGRRGVKTDPVWANRRRLLRGRESLSGKAFTAMWNGLVDNDPTGEVLAAWIAKEELRALLATAKTGAIRSDISHRLTRFYTWCANAEIDELTRLAGTIEAWWPEIEAFLQTGITNAATEGTNHLIKDAARVAFGFRNLDNQRRRVRYACTRRQRLATVT
ncbi:MAG: ISL3 family transposase [Actinobacteria bacterium]|nr:ISL3 family transposase [Actinomycetota bacterium]